MNKNVVSILLVGSLILFLSGDADLRAAPLRSKKKADSAVEQRNEDSAFSILMESYRFLNGYRIEADYAAQVKTAQSLTDPADREHALQAAGQDRELRLGKLNSTLTNFLSTYQVSREPEEPDRPASAPLPTAAARASH